MVTRLHTLPADAIARICYFIEPGDISRLACTCKSLRAICSDDDLIWQVKCAQAFRSSGISADQWISSDSNTTPGAMHDHSQWPPRQYKYAHEAVPRIAASNWIGDPSELVDHPWCAGLCFTTCLLFYLYRGFGSVGLSTKATTHT